LPYPIVSGGHQGLMNSLLALKDDYDFFIAFGVDDYEKYHEDKRNFLALMPDAHLLPLLNGSSSRPPLWYRFLSKMKHGLFSFQKRLKSYSSGDNREEDMCSKWMQTVSPLNKAWLEHISEICEEHHFDIIQVEMPWLISQVLTLPKDSKKIFVHHELGFVRRELEQNKYPDSVYVKAWRSFADMVEIELLDMYDAVVTVSPVDQQKLKNRGVKVPVFDSFLVVDIPLKPLSVKPKERQLTFVGPDSHVPNLVGITWFLENCWAALKNSDGNYKLNVIGEWSKEHIADYTEKYPDVDFLGFVEDLKAAISGTVMIVPITIGSGIRMKILEAASIGVPFVSTTVGAEGIPVKDGENCFIADTPQDFVDKIIRLQDKNVQENFISNAHSMVLNHYSAESLRKNRISIYKKIFGANE